MNGYQLTKQYFAFAAANPGATTPGMCALFMWLVEVNNRSRFTQNFFFNAEDAGYACGMQSRKTVWKYLVQLEGAGLVHVVYKSNNQERPSVLSLVTEVGGLWPDESGLRTDVGGGGMPDEEGLRTEVGSGILNASQAIVEVGGLLPDERGLGVGVGGLLPGLAGQPSECAIQLADCDDRVSDYCIPCSDVISPSSGITPHPLGSRPQFSKHTHQATAVIAHSSNCSLKSAVHIAHSSAFASPVTEYTNDRLSVLGSVGRDAINNSVNKNSPAVNAMNIQLQKGGSIQVKTTCTKPVSKTKSSPALAPKPKTTVGKPQLIAPTPPPSNHTPQATTLNTAKLTPPPKQRVNTAATPLALSYKGLNNPTNKNSVNGTHLGFGAMQEPELTEVSRFFTEHGYTANAAEKAWAHYRQANWHDVQGRPVLNWQQKCRTIWFTPENRIPTTQTRFVQ